MDLDTIKTKARRKLDETTAAFWEDDDLTDFVNDSYYYYWLWMIQAAHPITLKETTHNIVASTAEIALPSDWVESRLVERVYDNYTIPLWWNERFEEGNWTAGVSSTGVEGYSPRIRFVGANLVIEPTPSSSITGGIKHTYFYTPTELSTGTDTPTGPLGSQYAPMIIERVMLLAKEKEEAVGRTGVDMMPTSQILQQWEQKFKESIELPISHRNYVKPFGL